MLGRDEGRGREDFSGGLKFSQIDIKIGRKHLKNNEYFMLAHGFICWGLYLRESLSVKNF